MEKTTKRGGVTNTAFIDSDVDIFKILDKLILYIEGALIELNTFITEILLDEEKNVCKKCYQKL